MRKRNLSELFFIPIRNNLLQLQAVKMTKSNKMNPSFLLNSDNNGLILFSMLYTLRKTHSLSEKALFILLYIIETEKEDRLIETTAIGAVLGEGNRSNLFKAIQSLEEAGIVAESKTEREGSRNVRKIRISSENEIVKEVKQILEMTK